MARILVDLTSSGDGYTCENPNGCVMSNQGSLDNDFTWNIYSARPLSSSTLLGGIDTHGAAGEVSIPFDHTIRAAGAATNLVSIDTTPHNFREK